MLVALKANTCQLVQLHVYNAQQTHTAHKYPETRIQHLALLIDQFLKQVTPKLEIARLNLNVLLELLPADLVQQVLSVPVQLLIVVHHPPLLSHLSIVEWANSFQQEEVLVLIALQTLTAHQQQATLIQHHAPLAKFHQLDQQQLLHV
jgi:hypothetical protein